MLHTAIGDHDQCATGPQRAASHRHFRLSRTPRREHLPARCSRRSVDGRRYRLRRSNGWNLLLSFRSVTRLTTWVPWLCVPALRRVCRLSLEPATHPLGCRKWQHNILGAVMQRVSCRSFRSEPPITKPSFRDVTTRGTERGLRVSSDGAEPSGESWDCRRGSGRPFPRPPTSSTANHKRRAGTEG